MKKDIKWLREEIGTEMIQLEPNRKERWSDVKYQTLRSVAQKIDQLDEPEVLSHKWISDHIIFNEKEDAEYVYADKLQNLLVPKQEITEEQVMNWLDINEFYDHITAETVLERAVDKGELSYYGTKYSVIEAPTIPKYVADFIEVRKGTDAHSLKYILCVAVERGEQEECTKAYDWISANDETFARAWLDGFTVEEEQKYVVEIPNPNNHMGRHKNVFLNKKEGEVFIDSANLFVNDITKYGQYALTEDEIKKRL